MESVIFTTNNVLKGPDTEIADDQVSHCMLLVSVVSLSSRCHSTAYALISDAPYEWSTAWSGTLYRSDLAVNNCGQSVQLYLHMHIVLITTPHG